MLTSLLRWVLDSPYLVAFGDLSLGWERRATGNGQRGMGDGLALSHVVQWIPIILNAGTSVTDNGQSSFGLFETKGEPVILITVGIKWPRSATGLHRSITGHWYGDWYSH